MGRAFRYNLFEAEKASKRISTAITNAESGGDLKICALIKNLNKYFKDEELYSENVNARLFVVQTILKSQE